MKVYVVLATGRTIETKEVLGTSDVHGVFDTIEKAKAYVLDMLKECEYDKIWTSAIANDYYGRDEHLCNVEVEYSIREQEIL